MGTQLTTSGSLAISDSSSSLSFSAGGENTPRGDLNFTSLLQIYRQRAKTSGSQKDALEFIKFLVEAVKKCDTEWTSLGIDIPVDDRPGQLAAMKAILQKEALKWMRRLASSGNGHALFMLAEAYGQGLLGVAVDHKKAFTFYISASKQNHPTASYRAGVCYELGAGTKRDHQRAFLYYRKAAAHGDFTAMHKLALTLLYGKLGQRKDLRQGMTWLKRAAHRADQEHPEALHDLAQCFERSGGCPIVIPDETHAFSLYLQAAQLGFAPSQYRVGQAYERGLLGAPRRAYESIRWYRLAADQGVPEAQLALARWYLIGGGDDGQVRPDCNAEEHSLIVQACPQTAYLWARRAADQGLAKAQYTLGQFHERGIGVEADLQEAKAWYGMAAKQGDKRATTRLAELDLQDRRKKHTCRIS